MRLFGGLTAFAVTITMAAVQPQEAYAWGEYGHLTICDFAYRNLTDVSKQALKSLFSASNPITVNVDGNPRTYTSFNVGCLEEDEMPRKHAGDHFINVARSTPAISGPGCPVDHPTAKPRDCVLSGIERDLKILGDTSKSREQRVVALMAIGHWVGDIHQPLHISFADDRGGNFIKVSYSGGCGTGSTGNPFRPTNLHSVWDRCLLENGMFNKVRARADYKPNWGYRTMTYRAVDTMDANTTLAEKQLWTQTAPWEWADESYAITIRPGVQYCVKVGANCQYSPTMVTLPKNGVEKHVTVGPAYLAEFDDVAEARVRKAGVRLAHVLNKVLDPNYAGPSNFD